MRTLTISLIACGMSVACLACENESSRTAAIDADADGDTTGDDDTAGDGDADIDGDGDGDSDTDTDVNGTPVCVDQDDDGWCVPFDCNDADPLINPGSSEVDGDSVDNDCDGVVDGHIPGESPAKDASFLWISNTAEGTLSKIATREEREVARYETCGMDYCDPSRTSVNLYGDMVVTGRRQPGYEIPWSITGTSMVTKFSAYEKGCVDRNTDGVIQTSGGPDDVLAFGEDECMVWSVELPGAIGARGTAWDGMEDPATGVGGHVWVGTCNKDDNTQNETETIFVLNGDTGDIEDTIEVTGYCLYGAASDGQSVWFIDLTYPTIADQPDDRHFRLTRVDIETHAVETYRTDCSYGITVDARGRIWTGGYKTSMSNGHCVSRFDPNETDPLAQIKTVEVTDDSTFSWGKWLRGIGVGIGRSAGYAWVAQTNGTVHGIHEETVSLEKSIPVEPTLFTEGQSHIIGIGIDFDGYIWAVSQIGDAAYKIDPESQTHIKVPIGDGPYTYSDMTGIQLHNAVIAVE